MSIKSVTFVKKLDIVYWGYAWMWFDLETYKTGGMFCQRQRLCHQHPLYSWVTQAEKLCSTSRLSDEVRILPGRHHANTTNQAEQAISSKAHTEGNRGRRLRVARCPAVPTDLEGNLKAGSVYKMVKAVRNRRSQELGGQTYRRLWRLQFIWNFLNTAFHFGKSSRDNYKIR